ncbi:SidA/IucD/PvdA family monooxygenase [Streptomyces sp. SM11]|uniref:SidA/IucD/PvdA family monooxygenase n=1 Tax=Streptomyces sp. SM11 TaxID=565557 RepID=UPI0015E192CD|nr:SidA/IucD/PvdA family monooxygenase [Streptomyces sp. SM11]
MESLSLQDAERRFGAGRAETRGLICVVGAGPKALATAAKSQVLRELGVEAPRVLVVEPYGVGANWTAAGGRTNGRPRLSTSPEKDLGFPYTSQGHGTAIDASVNTLMQKFSWTAFLVSAGRYAAWVDAGRPSPRHLDWAAYLRWAAERTDFPLVSGWVRRLETSCGQWEVTVEGSSGGSAALWADRVMISGPGPHGGRLADDAICTVEEFWRLGLDTTLVDPAVAVVGGGETAAAVVEDLVRQHSGRTTVISPYPVVYSRGEGFFENALYSSPERWRELPEQDRREVIARTDRGVYSPRAIEAITTEATVLHQQGTVTAVRRADTQVELELHNPGRAARTLRFDVVIDATGARPDWFLDLLADRARSAVAAIVGDAPETAEALERHIRADLSLDGLRPKLLLPTLAAYAQGPGFANLSSLGLLSDRVLAESRDTSAPATRPRVSLPEGGEPA